VTFNDIDNFAVVVQRQSVIHTENSGFASPTLGQHISTFRGYRILFSIINVLGKNDCLYVSVFDLSSVMMKQDTTRSLQQSQIK
jgi:hypothetical protein